MISIILQTTKKKGPKGDKGDFGAPGSLGPRGYVKSFKIYCF